MTGNGYFDEVASQWDAMEDETCCAACGCGSASVSIFAAYGVK
ncbi:hypothetical protein [Spirochaeta thermophila]|nr:hypothetical protein [Spirochaeta thermophila]